MKKSLHTVMQFFIMSLLLTLSLSAFSATKFMTKEGKINVPGGQVWYKIISTEKTQDNTPLLILHGGPGLPHNYLNVLEALAKDRPVIFYDQLGCGHSEIPKNNNQLWQLKRFEQELENVVSGLHLKKFYLYGHSWGGTLALEYTLHHPANIQSIILASPLLSTAQWIQTAHTLLKQLSPSTQKTIVLNEKHHSTNSPSYLKAIDSYYHHFFCRLKIWPADLNYSMEHLNYDVYKTMWGPSELTATGNLKNFTVLNALSHLSMPVLITAGKYDEAGAETLREATQQIKQGKFILYHHSAHVAFLEEKQQYLDDLGNYLLAQDKQQNSKND